MLGRRIQLLLLLTGASVLLFAPAHASSPKDAIKRLPKFTHTSRFHIDQNDGPNGRTYNDNYVGSWTIDWNPPAVALGPRAKLSYSVKYALTLQDLINRIDHRSNDLRQDYFQVDLNLKNMQWFDAGYTMSQTDQYKINKEWGSTHTQSGRLAWSPPMLPSLGYGFTNTIQTRKTNAGQSVASEIDAVQYHAEYKTDTGAFGQRYYLLNQDQRTRNYLNNSGTDEHTSNFEGYRQLPLGSAGNLNLSYYYNQYSHSDISVADASTTTTNRYTLALSNRLPAIPVEYNYAYSDTQQESPNGAAKSIALRSLNLAVTPPTPEGKSAAVGYYDELREETTDPGKRIANAKQILRWNVTPNRLTSANFSYELDTDYDRDLQELSHKREGYTGNLSYNIPGERGNLSGNLSEWVESQPRSGARNVSNNLTLNNNLRLGSQANISFSLAQIYTDTESGVPNASWDTTTSRVRYNISWPRNLSLDATYQSQLATRTVDNKTSSETLGLTFNYHNDANWDYRFALNFGDTHDNTRITPDSRQYETQNVIEATITYSF